MKAHPLVLAGLVAVVIVLIIGVIAAYFNIPYALQIIVAALTAFAGLISAISRPGVSRKGGAKKN